MFLGTITSPQHGWASPIAAIGDTHGWKALEGISLGELLQSPNWRARADHELQHSPDRLPESEVTHLTPLSRPGKILCCGLNYRDHIAETGRDTPTYPTLFAKFADTLTGPFTDIQITATSRVDWEAELAVVVGREVYRADRRTAEEAILGYTIANDISMRDWQQRTLQWLQGKAFDSTTPVGPRIVTADALDPRDGLAIECRVNGEIVQQSNTRELLFDAAHLIEYISSFTRLLPGDMILTGTPGGVAMGMEHPRYLQDGDRLTTSIQGIGELRNSIRFTAN